jgi:choline dehydrogenase-like flavoprotein
MSNSNTFDAIVVGSGISGGWAAKELTQKGLRTLVLERGRAVEHVKDYPTTFAKPWELPHRGQMPLEELKKHPIQDRTGFAANEEHGHFFTNDLEHPYVEEKRFDWIRGWQVGGKSLTWGRITLRMSDLDFEANAREGIAIDWPIRYRDIAPWYDYVERFAGISGNRDGIPTLPDGVFQPPMPMNCVEEYLCQQIKQLYGGDRHVIHARQAHLTAPTAEQQALGRGSCQYRDLCMRGCPYGAYFSSQSATLPAAQKTGRLTVRPNSIVHSVIYDERLGKATGVRVIDQNTHKALEFKAKVIFLNASALGSTFILMNSKSGRFPNGLGNDSDVLGRYLTDHHFGAGARAEYEGFADMYYAGRKPNGIYIPRYQNIGNDKRDYLRGYGYEGWSGRSFGQQDEGFGKDFKENYAKLGNWNLEIMGFAETLPYAQNHVRLSPTEQDKWGLPLLVMSAEFGENERKMRVDMQQDAAEMLEKAGFTNIESYDDEPGFGLSIHEMGTARMGRDPKTSILNQHNQVWGCPNVFVTDGACMTSASNVNPSLTYMALTARAADFAVKALKRRDL